MKPDVLGKLLAAGASLECELRGFGAASVGVVVGRLLLALGVECSAMDPKGVAKDEHRRDGLSCRFCAYGTGASVRGCFFQPALPTARPYHPSQSSPLTYVHMLCVPLSFFLLVPPTFPSGTFHLVKMGTRD